ncbi:MAG: sulfatase [Acidobacteriota bacterium]
MVIDTLRADHLPIYGYDRDTSPFLTELADQAVVFEDCRTPIPLTDPAFASLLTGAYPMRHGVRDTGYALAGHLPTLAEMMAAQGYRTAGFFSRAGLVTTTGLGRGFALADDQTTTQGEVGRHPWYTRAGAEMWQRRADEVTDLAIEWMEKQSNEPFFLLLHYFDPHAYYDPPSPFRGRFEPRVTPYDDEELRSWWGSVDSLGAEISRYDEEILTVDHHLARFVEAMRLSGVWDRTLLVVTADHGESLGEHGAMDHGEWLYREQVHVPLIIRAPENPSVRGVRIPNMVRLIDVAPTILDFIGATDSGSGLGNSDGTSLMPLLRGEYLPGRVLLLETENCPEGGENRQTTIGVDCDPPGVLGKRRGVVEGRWKLILAPTPDGPTVQLFDQEMDPGEVQDVSGRNPDVVARLLDILQSSAGPGTQGTVDHELIERLRALGYAG